MGKEPIGSKVSIPESGVQCCLGPLFGVNQPSKIQPCRSSHVLGRMTEGSCSPGTNYLSRHLRSSCEQLAGERPGWGFPHPLRIPYGCCGH